MFRLIALLAFVSTAAFAADVPKATSDFVNKAAVANKYEIDTSQLALKYGKSADVKTFAQQMIDDHTKVKQDFTETLKQAGITPPADSLDVTHTAKYAKLRLFTTENGFDAAYVDAQVQAHKEAVGLFKSYVADGPTAEVKAFAEKTLPQLEHHLSMIEGIQGKLPKS